MSVSRFFDKSFFLGLSAGIILTAAIAIIFVAAYYPPPEQHMIRGSITSGNYVPSVGEHGVVAAMWEGVYQIPGCEEGWYCWPCVVFENDPGSYPIPVEVATGGANGVGVGTSVICINPSAPGNVACFGVTPPENWLFPQVSCP